MMILDSISRHFFQWLIDIMQAVLHHLSSCRNGYIWFFLTCLFALLIPALARLAIPNFGYTVERFLSEGDIAIFSMVVVTSLAIDHFVFEEEFHKLLGLQSSTNSQECLIPDTPDISTRITVFIFPMFAITACLIIYLRCQLLQCFDNATVIMEMIAFLSVAAYAAFVKRISFNKKQV